MCRNCRYGPRLSATGRRREQWSASHAGVRHSSPQAESDGKDAAARSGRLFHLQEQFVDTCQIGRIFVVKLQYAVAFAAQMLTANIAVL